jgi:hypothetical protein
MSYLSCPRCRLTIRIRAPYLALRNCPRCLAHAGLPTPMYTSSRRVSASPLDDPTRSLPRAANVPETDGHVTPLRIVDSSGRSAAEREPPRMRGVSGG